MNWIYYALLWLSVGVNIFAAILNSISRSKYEKARKICDECIASYDSVVKEQQELINTLMLERSAWIDDELDIIDLDHDETNNNEENGGNENEEE